MARASEASALTIDVSTTVAFAEPKPCTAGFRDVDDGAVNGGEAVRIVFTHLHNSAFVTCVGEVL
jgi:hypothetical protein